MNLDIMPLGETPYEPEMIDEFHSTSTVSLGELIRYSVIVWGAPEMMWDYYDLQQYWRVCQKLEQRYWHRDIGFNTPGEFKQQLVRHMNEVMPKWKYAYKMLSENMNLLRVADLYGKNRTVNSDFPATQLDAEHNDYASTADDHEFETVTDGDWLERIERLKSYNDIDLEIVKSCDILFSSLITVNMNGGTY